MLVEILAIRSTPDGGVCLRFAGQTRDDFDAMRLRIKALGVGDHAWQPQAFNGRGGWWLSARAWAKLGPQFQNYARLRARLAAGDEGLPDRENVPPAVEQAFQVLHLRPTAPVWAVQAVYRGLAKRAHLDLGGSEALMKAINAAYEVARAWAERRANADFCPVAGN
jgi:hypothetical protein